ncbi:MAG: glycoside hydrolase TIM-barrel-like domain-containing protein, partial [Rickettsiales bacterium]|nr:glycoside hydrolase TIM-barrel-like domain-containing protein [Rickettsiales bacterium]
MTTFIFTQALNAINSKKESVAGAFNSSPIGEVLKYTRSRTKWKKDRISGKLSEISIQTSTYNKVISMVYGRNRLAGNVLWLGSVQEVANNNTTSVNIGKGQKIKQTSIDYFYFLSFAIAICAGEIASLENVWADTTLLNLANYSHRFYSGTSGQLPDTLIESIEGAGNVPAYRDISYIVFENFPLSEFNNRIPNFLFEVIRKNEIDSGSPTSLENCIEGINIVPSYGEYTLNTAKQYKAGEQFASNFSDTADGLWYPLNINNNSGSTDSLASLGQLSDRLVNCQWFSVQTAFFGDSLDISSCSITPRVSFNYFHTGYPIFTTPDPYYIGNKWNRYNSPLLGTNSDGSPRFFSGSSSDESIVSFFQRLKSMGKNTVFHPKILMDLEGVPSSRLLTGNINSISNFFTKANGYNEFILHYANLLKDYLDAFLIGSELTGLISFRDDNNKFPAVDNLIDLAQQVRAIVGNSV